MKKLYVDIVANMVQNFKEHSPKAYFNPFVPNAPFLSRKEISEKGALGTNGLYKFSNNPET